MIVVYILIFILVLGLVVCFHELGHYFWAKKFGILVNEFAFGMGPKIVSKKKGETYWSIRAFPVGGFCAMSGEEVGDPLLKEGDQVKLVFDENNKVSKIVFTLEAEEYKDIEITTVEKVDLFGKDMSPLYINDFEVNRNALVVVGKEETQIAPEERNFYAKGVWQRLLVCFGGPLNNFILGLVVFLLMAFIQGVPNTRTNKIKAVDGPSEVAGLKGGDRIIKVGDYEITEEGCFDDTSNNSLHYAIYNTPSRALNVSYDRNGEIKNTTVYASYTFNALGFASYDEDINESNYNEVKIICETKAALAGTNKTKAYQAENGLRNGDIITAITYYNGETEVVYPIADWEDVYEFSLSDNARSGGKISVTYLRDSESKTTGQYEIYSETILSSQGYELTYKQMGVSTPTKFTFFESIWNGIKYFGKASSIIFNTLWLLFTSKEVGIKDMGGFITILNQTASYAAGGFVSLLYFIGLLSVNLGIVNLLPIPALDGGRILFLLIEGIFHKKLKPKVEAIIINVVFWLLMAFIGYILIQDIIRLVVQLR